MNLCWVVIDSNTWPHCQRSVPMRFASFAKGITWLLHVNPVNAALSMLRKYILFLLLWKCSLLVFTRQQLYLIVNYPEAKNQIYKGKNTDPPICFYQKVSYWQRPLWLSQEPWTSVLVISKFFKCTKLSYQTEGWLCTQKISLTCWRRR